MNSHNFGLLCDTFHSFCVHVHECMCIIVCFPPTDRECFVRQMKITCCQKAWEIEKNLLPEFITSCIPLVSASHTWMDVIYSILMILCVFCFPSGSWERRSSLRSWSWSNSKGSTGCVKELVLGKSVAAEDKVRHTVFTYMTHPYAFKLTVHPQLRANQISVGFTKSVLQFPLCASSLSILSAPRSSLYSLCGMKTLQEMWDLWSCGLLWSRSNDGSRKYFGICLPSRQRHIAAWCLWHQDMCLGMYKHALQIWCVKKFKYT